MAGPPPTNGGEIIAWVKTLTLVVSLATEALFSAVMSLVPAVVALYSSLADAHPIKAVVACGIMDRRRWRSRHYAA